MNNEMVIGDVLRGEPLDLRKIDTSIAKSVCGVYAIYCEPEAKYYIGSSMNIYARVREHFWYIRGQQWSNRDLCTAARKHGSEAFTAFILETCEPKELEALEQKWIKLVGFDRLYNHSDRPVLRNKKHFSEYKIEGEMSIEELRIELRKKTRAFQMAWQKVGLDNYAKLRAATPHEIDTMRNYYNAAKHEARKTHTPRKEKQSALTQNPAAANVLPSGDTKPEASALEVWELFAINFLEMALIIIGLARLYEWPGLVLAAMCCLFLFKAQHLARKPKLSEAGKNALNVVLAMCVASGLLHIVTFWNAVKVQTTTFNDESEIVTDWPMFLLKITSAVLPAVFVAYISFNAVNTTAKIYRK